MARLDGTGPRGAGPLTGRGEGYCAVQLPDPGTGQAGTGFAGLAGRPVRLNSSAAPYPPVRRASLFGRFARRWAGRGRRRSAMARRGGRFGVRR